MILTKNTSPFITNDMNYFINLTYFDMNSTKKQFKMETNNFQEMNKEVNLLSMYDVERIEFRSPNQYYLDHSVLAIRIFDLLFQ